MPASANDLPSVGFARVHALLDSLIAELDKAIAEAKAARRPEDHEPAPRRGDRAVRRRNPLAYMFGGDVPLWGDYSGSQGQGADFAGRSPGTTA